MLSVGLQTTHCFDEEPAVHANQSEVCDGLDNDCDGFTDDEDDQLEEFIGYQ